MRTCAGSNTVRRLLLCLPLLLTLMPFIPGEALGKGGTNMHEMAAVFPAVGKAVSKTVGAVGSWKPSFILGGCGHGRYRVAITHKCRGPAGD